MKDIRITKGDWWPCCKDTRPHFVFVGEEDKVVCSVSSNEKGTDDYEPMMAEVSMAERIANAALIADAGNTAQKCGLLPSELLKQRDELTKMLNSLMLSIAAHPDYVSGDDDDEWHTLLSIAEDLITKTEED